MKTPKLKTAQRWLWLSTASYYSIIILVGISVFEWNFILLVIGYVGCCIIRENGESLIKLVDILKEREEK